MKLLKQAIIGSLSFSVTLLAACGGDDGATGSTSSATLVSASSEIGQVGFTQSSGNQGGSAGPSTLASPQGSIAAKGTTLLYVADTANNRVLGYNTATPANGAAANFVLGQGGLTGFTPSSAGLVRPQKVSISDNGAGTTLVITDTGNNRILVFTGALPTANNPTPAAGAAVVINGGAGTNYVRFNHPTAAVIATGPTTRSLVVVDQDNNRVLVFNDVDALLAAPTTTDADAVLGQPDFDPTVIANTQPNQGVAPVTSNGLRILNGPTDVWSDGFSLLVSDTNNSRVLYWDHVPDGTLGNTEPAKSVLGQSSTFSTTKTATIAGMNTPTSLDSDENRIFVSDAGNNRVVIFEGFPTAQTGTPAAYVVGQQDFSHNAANDDSGASTGPQDSVSDAAPTARTLRNPNGVLFSTSTNTLYVTDTGNSRVLLFPQSQLTNN